MGNPGHDRPDMDQETGEETRPREPERDPPGKPFRTPNKTKTHAAPDIGTDGLKPWPEQTEPNKR